jgi:hypothetical protein
MKGTVMSGQVNKIVWILLTMQLRSQRAGFIHAQNQTMALTWCGYDG